MAGEPDRLNDLLAECRMEPLDEATEAKFFAYLELLLKWNRQLNLTAIQAREEILRRHFVESIFCARSLPAGLTTLLDYGSGSGFPGIPIACCRPEMVVTLAESQGKKATFLREVVRTLDLYRPALSRCDLTAPELARFGLSTLVYGRRAETLPPQSFDAATLRAVDRMAEAVKVADRLIAPAGWMVLMIGSAEIDAYRAELPGYEWMAPLKIPSSDRGALLLGQRRI